MRLGLVAALLACCATAAVAAPADAPRILPNDPAYQQDPGAYSQTDAEAGWAATQSSPCTTRVAVLDNAATVTPDLPLVSLGADFAPGTGDSPHGTEVASIIDAAVGNGIGVPGISNCPVLSVRVMDSTEHWDTDWLTNGLDWACAQAGVRVVNLSLWEVAGTDSPAVDAALSTCLTRGVLPVLIAGNGSNNDLQGTSDPSANLLAANNPNAVRVAGVDPSGQIDPASNHGAALADIAAPYEMPLDLPDGSWSIGGGTSYAAPQVAATAAELFNLDPSLTPAQVKQLLLSSGSKVQGLDVGCGCVLDVYDALVAAGYGSPAQAGLTVTVTGRGKVVDGTSSISCGLGGASCSVSGLRAGSREQLTAAAAPGWRLSRWTGACTGAAPTCAVTLQDAVAAVGAVFVASRAELTVAKAGTGKGAVASRLGTCPVARTRCVYSAAVGAAVRLTASPARGSRFAGWSGGCAGTGPVCTLRLAKSAVVTARFAAKPRRG